MLRQLYLRLKFILGSISLPLLAAGCSPPPMEVTKVDVLLGDAVSIKSKATQALLIRSAVANGNDGNSNCDKAVGKSLAPGDSTTLLFVGCGDVMELTVKTDMGSGHYSFKK